MIDHCVSAFYKEQEEKAYRIYITDGIKVLVDNTARIAGGAVLNKRYIDMVEPKEEETRTAKDVIDGIKKKFRGGD